MFLFFCSIVFATAAGVTAFLLLSSRSLKDFKRRFFHKTRVTKLPIVTQDGKLVGSKDELDAHLEVLETKLLEKVSEIEVSKNRVQDAKQSIERLNSTQSQVKKYYVKLREEIKKSEEDCKNLQQQIDDYRRRRAELDNEMKRNEQYYKTLLDAVRSDDSLDSAAGSSKMSMSSESSTTSFYDSSSYATNDGRPICEKIQKTSNPETGIQKIENSTHSSPVSKVSSKCSMTDESFLGLQKKVSLPSLEIQKDNCKRPSSAPKKASQHPTRKTSDTNIKGQKVDEKGTNVQKQISTSSLENKKDDRNEGPTHDLELKGSKSILLPHQLSGCALQKLKVKSLKGEICCCGASKCPGTCNLARCIKLGFLKPKDILSVEVAEHVDVLTGKIICSKNCHHKLKTCEPCKRPISPRNGGKFS